MWSLLSGKNWILLLLQKENIFQFGGFLVYSSNSSGLFLSAKPKHPDGREVKHPANGVPSHTHTPLLRWVNSQLVSRCNEEMDMLLKSPAYGKDGEKPESRPTLPACCAARGRTYNYHSMSVWQTIKMYQGKLLITKLFIDTEEQKENKRKLGLAR